MTRYAALVDGEAGAYGVVFPDLSGCTSMGNTVDEALVNAGEALRMFVDNSLAHGETVPPPRPLEELRSDPDVIKAMREGAFLTSVALVSHLGKFVRTNLSLDDGVLAAIDAEAARRKMTRSAVVAWMARELLPRVA